MDFHLTQGLTGHECFAAYIKRFGKSNSAACWFCGHHTDDVEHTLFECDAWAAKRRICNLTVEEELDGKNLVDTMLSGRRNWDAVRQYVNEVMKAKEDEERRRERHNF